MECQRCYLQKRNDNNNVITSAARTVMWCLLTSQVNHTCFPVDSHKHKDKHKEKDHRHKDHKKDKEREKAKHSNRYCTNIFSPSLLTNHSNRYCKNVFSPSLLTNHNNRYSTNVYSPYLLTNHSNRYSTNVFSPSLFTNHSNRYCTNVSPSSLLTNQPMLIFLTCWLFCGLSNYNEPGVFTNIVFGEYFVIIVIISKM